METPTSIRRVTRSQTKAAMNKSTPIAMIRSNMNEKTDFKQSDRSALISTKNGSQIKSAGNSGSQNSMPSTKKKELTKSKQTNEKRDRSALINITNGSPIAGIAMGNLKSPSSLLCSKKKKINLSTPCSGETLLRGQVKTLLMNKKNIFQLQEEDENNHELPEFCFDEHPLLKTTSLPTQVTQHFKITQGRVMKMDVSKREENVNVGSKRRLRTRSLLSDFYTEMKSSEKEEKEGALVEEMCKGVSQMKCK